MTRRHLVAEEPKYFPQKFDLNGEWILDLGFSGPNKS